MPEPLRRRDEFESSYEDRVHAPVRQRGSIPAAGVYLAGGRWHVASYGGAAEGALRRAGAVLVASVSFDGAPVPALTGGSVGVAPPGRLAPWRAG